MNKKRVSDIMTSPAIVVGSDMSVSAASALMRQHGIRHLPVVENNRLIGIVSRGDLREASFSEAVNADTFELHFMLNRLTVGRLMTAKVYSVTSEAPLVHAAELMTEHRIAGLPVVDESGEVVGIVTESDLLKMLVRHLHEVEDATETSTAAETSAAAEV